MTSMDSPFFSVIVPNYNAERYIKKCLDSLSNQSFKDFEIVITDDCSADNSVHVIESYKNENKLDIVLLKNEVNSGPGKSRESAVRVAKGQYIAFCDSDDWYDNNYLKLAYDTIIQTSCDVCLCGFKSVLVKNKKEKITYHRINNKIEKMDKAQILTINIDGLCTMVVKRTILDDIKFPDIRNGEDMALMGLKTEQRKLMNISFLITAFIGIGSMFGLLAIAKEFAVIYFGESFASCGGIMMALSPLVYIIGTGSVLRSQCLIPNGMDKQFNFSILYNAIINIVLSLSLIPRIGVYGAVIGTFSAELFGLVYQLYICKSFISISDLLKTVTPFSIMGMIMFIFIKIIEVYVMESVAGLLIKIAAGAVIYCILSGVYIVMFNKDTRVLIAKKIRGRREK